jgi:hypothetical protein
VPTDNPLAGLLRPGLSVVVSIDTRQEGDTKQVGTAGAVALGRPRTVAASAETR